MHFLRLIILLLLIGCQVKENNAGPPDIHLGEDTCHECHMMINDLRFASASRNQAGEALLFDDIGDMFVFFKKQGVSPQIWVHDADDQEWMEADQATYIFSRDIKSPMGHGILASRSPEHAQKLASKYANSQVYSFQKALAQFSVK